MITNLRGTSDLQQSIIDFINEWAHKNNNPIPRKIVMKHMSDNGNPKTTVISALNVLVSKGYIRRAVTISNTTSYVLLRM